MRSWSGVYVVLAGPDGSGKSTLASRLAAAARRSGRPARHLHWRPGLLPQAGSLVGRAPGDPSTPHAEEPQGRVLSLLRLVYYWADFLLGTWLRVQPITARGGLVVMERGWWDIAVDPRRYRLRVGARVIRALGRLLPAPDLVLVLRASPEILAQRKEELPTSELARQNDRWDEIRFPQRIAKIVLDATRSQDDLVADAAAHMATVSGGDPVGAGGVE
ncbi:MAG TPA: hypothetical protein VF058_02130 [Actinomycetota bacterium]